MSDALLVPRDVRWCSQVPSIAVDVVILDRVPASAREWSWVEVALRPRLRPEGLLIVGEAVGEHE